MTSIDNLEHMTHTHTKKKSRKSRLRSFPVVNLTNYNYLLDIIPHKRAFGELKQYYTGIDYSSHVDDLENN